MSKKILFVIALIAQLLSPTVRVLADTTPDTSWRSSNSQVVVTNGSGSNQNSSQSFKVLSNSTDWQNATVSLKITPAEMAANGAVVLLSHFLNEDTYYGAGLSASGQAVITKRLGGQEETLKTSPIFSSLPQNEVGLKLEMKTNSDDSVTLHLLVDKNGNNNWAEAGQLTDRKAPIHESGAVGLAVRAAKISFNNLSATSGSGLSAPTLTPVSPPAPVPVVISPAPLSAVTPTTVNNKSPIENGHLVLRSVTGLPTQIVLGGSATVKTSIISDNGGNANNVSVHLELYDAQGQVADRADLSGVNILHENPATFTLQTKSTLPPGNYALAVRVDNSDELVNAWFPNLGTLTVSVSAANSGVTNNPAASQTQAQVPVPVSTSPVVTTQIGGSNPFAGKNFYLDPNSDAKRLADSWRASRPGDAAKLDKIAQVSQARWLGDWNSDIESDTRSAMSAAATTGTYPVFVIYNIPNRDCGGYSAGGSNNPDGYRNWIKAFVRGLGTSAAAVVVEPDALAGISCLSNIDQQTRFDLVKFAVDSIKAQGKTAVYLDAGHPNWISADDMANRLKKAGIDHADGFALNVSNFYSTAENTNYGQQLSAAVGGKHFIVDTSRNGAGSVNNEWCNPAGRALGTPSTTSTGNSLIDAYFWLKTPGQSDGACNGGPNAGQWWTDYALGLAARATW